MKQHTAAIVIAAVKALRESARDMTAEAIQTAAMAEKLIQYTERQEG